MSCQENQYVDFPAPVYTIDHPQLSSFGPKGSWAVITGASDGIGKEYALQLARKGFNLILVSRTQAKLTVLADQIKASSPSTTVETLSVDFSRATDDDYTSLSQLLQSKKISILINNVGQSHSIPVPFTGTPLPEYTNIININCLATLRVTQTVLPSMLPHKRGLILTMGSFGGLMPSPLLATYSGSKAFLQQWSNSLASELSSSGITVHFIHSYLVTSSMSKIRRPNWQVPSEKNFVRSALSKIGRRGGSVGYTYSGSPYWSHAIIAAFVTGALGVYNKAVTGFIKNMHVSIRKRALKKAERQKSGGGPKKEL